MSERNRSQNYNVWLRARVAELEQTQLTAEEAKHILDAAHPARGRGLDDGFCTLCQSIVSKLGEIAKRP